MKSISFLRRDCLALALSGLLLAGCSDKPADATASGFSGIDITGADFATGFSLPDHNGQMRTLADFRGRVVVVFFGFTQCPDVCPTSLGELAEAKRLLGDQGERLQGIFISLDPERDTPEIMREYMAHFDPGFLSLYASPEVLPDVAKHFRVYYKKQPGSTPTSYTMEHKAGSHLYDTQGRVRVYHHYGKGAQALAGDLKRLLSE